MNKKRINQETADKPFEQQKINNISQQREKNPRNNMMLLIFITMMAVVWGLVYWLFIV